MPKAKTPPWIEIRPSRIPGAGSGAFARVDLPAGKRLGEYTGRVLTAQQFDKAEDRRYVWEVEGEDGEVRYLDGRPRRHGNWTRYVNCPRRRSEENVTAVQERGRMYYYAKRTIKSGEELLVWYGRAYGEWLLGKGSLD